MSQALSLLFSGMTTIFVVLSLVVLVGNLLIRLVNRWTPNPVVLSPVLSENDIPPSQIAAIVAAVEFATKGQGKIGEITREQ